MFVHRLKARTASGQLSCLTYAQPRMNHDRAKSGLIERADSKKGMAAA